MNVLNCRKRPYPSPDKGSDIFKGDTGLFMSLKDPDYPDDFKSKSISVYRKEDKNEKEKNTIRDSDNPSSKVIESVKAVIHAEFDKSISQKNSELDIIDAKIQRVQKALHLVRYGSVCNFYASTTTPQTKADPENVSFHPAVRSLFGGKTPKSESTSGYQRISTLEKISKPVIPKITPGYVPPKCKESISTTEPRGTNFKFKKRIIIGNVSKWISCDERGQDQSTHKWMIYVRGGPDSPDISDLVSKVKFLIHSSYYPHDIIEVKEPPFHLTRRGWGEFPARIQIHFKHQRDKPVDVIHNLKLDRTYTGLQTLGSETLVDVWLHNPDYKSVNLKKPPSEDIPQNFGGSLFRHTDESDLRSSSQPALKSCVENSTKLKEIHRCKTDKSVNGDSDVSAINASKSSPTTFIKCNDKSGKTYYLPVNVPPSIPSKKSGGTPPGCKLILSKDGQVKVVKSSAGLKTDSPDKNSELSLLNNFMPPSPSSVLKPGTSLLKKGFDPVIATSNGTSGTHLTDLEKTIPEISLSAWSRIFGRASEDGQLEIENRVAKRGIQYLKKQTEYISIISKKVLSLSPSEFPSWERMMAYIVKYFPLLTPLASDPLYRAIHPYSAPSEKDFLNWNKGKQKACEWTRAKTLQRIWQYLNKNENSLSTKRIWNHLRRSGFSVRNSSSLQKESPAIRTKIENYSTFSLPSFIMDNLETFQDLKPEVLSLSEEVDVENESPDKKEIQIKKRESLYNETRLKHPSSYESFGETEFGAYRFVENVMKETGLCFDEPSDSNGVVEFPFAQRVMFQACKSFCELALRQAFKCSKDNMETKEDYIDLNDVRRAFKTEPSLRICTNAGLGVNSFKTEPS